MLAAIEETVVASGVGGVQGMGRREYEGEGVKVLFHGVGGVGEWGGEFQR